ncbi:WW domain-binding protein 11 [Clonorchis sinensis]|uniref:WW domain-binding protein 11 n=1 Tax=Clonorchis sinensis TaxID=79923 RepID=G7YLS9_CLOSI|nr:WW domain-binding protein 11 [Clonorchis sinensis]
MGRRSVNTTKSGKFMNPTDQARKEARKRELKKNKKQRMAVRHAVLKAKDPLQLLEETALYDKQEQVKLAERVKTSDIPLPKLPQSQMGLIASDIPLPTGSYAKSILKKSLGAPGLPPGILPAGRKPPAPPPGPPPELSDSDGEDSSSDLTRQRKIRFADSDFPLAAAGDNLSNQANASLMEAPSKFPSGFSIGSGLTCVLDISGLPFVALVDLTPSLHPRDPLDNADILGAPAVHPASSLPPTSKAGSATGTTIEAKPQLKNLIGDATRFVPTAIKIRRTTRDPTGRLVTVGGGVGTHGPGATGKTSVSAYDRISRADGTGSASAAASASKDDAYEEFMREMEGLL